MSFPLRLAGSKKRLVSRGLPLLHNLNWFEVSYHPIVLKHCRGLEGRLIQTPNFAILPGISVGQNVTSPHSLGNLNSNVLPTKFV